jgi:thiol-disulfide isomerase/thioredoxin
MTRLLTIVGMAGLLMAAGCKEQPPGKPAEVPKAGPAAEKDIGPAPAGQDEPATKPAESATSQDELQENRVKLALAEDLPNDPYAEMGGIDFISLKQPAKDDAKVEVKTLDWKETEALIATHKGKVVVVDMWSLSCVPCRKEFPNLVKLHNAKGDQVACISVSTDYSGIKSKPVKSYEPKVLAFLTDQKATFENVLCSVASDVLFDELGLSSIPAVYVYGKDGQLAKKFAGERVDYEKEVVPFVESLVK